MYWNNNGCISFDKEPSLNSNIRCIEIYYDSIGVAPLSSLNSNIRCIEIRLNARSRSCTICWIVTLDVLKWLQNLEPFIELIRLNSNIRCIEMRVWSKGAAVASMLNSNIRCIEICQKAFDQVSSAPLNSNIRCIEIQ